MKYIDPISIYGMHIFGAFHIYAVKSISKVALALPVILFMSIGLPYITGVSVTTSTSAPTSCQLNSPNGEIRHVIYIQFDNTHLLRDTQTIPSDLQQMPHLLNFIQNNGTMLTDDHTVLIS